MSDAARIDPVAIALRAHTEPADKPKERKRGTRSLVRPERDGPHRVLIVDRSGSRR